MTLRGENVLWLKGQAAATGKGSVSEVVDALVTKARTEGRGTVVSVAGTIDLRPGDDLEWADAYVRSMFEGSVRRPMLARERPPKTRRDRG